MCDNENYSCLVGILLAILLGFLIGLLVFLGILTNLTVGLIVAIVSAFVISIAFFVTIVLSMYCECVRRYSCQILIGIIGTILFATIALSITLGANIGSAILVGLVVFFLTYLIIKFLKLLSCIIRMNCNNNSINLTSLDTTLNIGNSLNNEITSSDIINNTTINNNSNNNNSDSNNNSNSFNYGMNNLNNNSNINTINNLNSRRQNCCNYNRNL